jgi:lipoate-protein ligase A
MHHGTLMWDTDVDAMVRSLNVADEKFISKAAKSVRARVGNIKNYAPENQTLEGFMDALRYYLSNQGKDGELILTDDQIADIKRWRNERFSTWEWNYGKSPDFDFVNHAKYAGGSVDVKANVKEGKIQDIDFTGDFLGVRDWREMKDEFIGQTFSQDAILKVLDANKDGQYFGGITNNELAVLFTGDGDK